jgi:hypothetical protein
LYLYTEMQTDFPILDEFVLQPTLRASSETSASDPAPEPLLPNYGVGRIRRYNQDINMMCMLNAKERTLQEFVNLGCVPLWFGPADS